MKKCTKCGSESVIIEKKHSGQLLCGECFTFGIKKKVLKDIRKYELIEKGDKVLIALSGGKDSVMLLDILNILYEQDIIDLYAITIDEGIAGYREDGVKIAFDHAKRLGIEHEVVKFSDEYGISLDEIMSSNPDKNACSYCGVLRRDIFNKWARKVGADKIATGHNLDDESQTVLMNYLEGNLENLSRVGAKTESKHEMFTVKIKPLRNIPEKEIALYDIFNELDIHLADCLYSSESFRNEVSGIIKDLSKSHPTIMYSTIRGFDKLKPMVKDNVVNEYDLKNCDICGEPSSHSLCRVCTLLKEFK